MLKCEGGCQRMCEEYYRMQDGKTFCYDCWKRGIERAERIAEHAAEMHRAQVDKQQFEFRQTLQRVDAAQKEHVNIEEQIRTLRDKIRYEKETTRGRHSYFASTDDYANPSYAPYNYAKVRSMERDLEALYNRRDLIACEARLRPRIPSPIPEPIPFRFTSYFTNAKWISKQEAHYYETVILPVEIKEKQERELAEADRLQKEIERQRKETERQQKEIERQRKVTERRIKEEKRRLEAEAEQKRLAKIEQTKREMMKLEQSAQIDKVWVDYDVMQNNMQGMNIHIKFQIFNMLYLEGEIAVYFYAKPSFFRSAKPLKDENNSYYSVDGQVAVSSVFIPNYQNCSYSDFMLFMPYQELHRPKGDHDIIFRIEIFSHIKRSLATYWDKGGFHYKQL